ncbi:PRC-barrel domain containing protein [Halomarina litorea]|uniref:PRC-barrel domain containing protein n=1 Tax=Halomarina litorea TaxID=2961595 RepID=UPI0020C36993|nr:PRC-barrel domain containing protein [Halomarina sp. BCD28]
MQQTRFSESDEGKKVVNANGDTVGRIVEVRSGTAYVDPDPSIADTLLSKLGWAEMDEDTYPLRADRISAITDDEVRLERF